VLAIAGDRVAGVSCGDSGAWVVHPDRRVDDLTARQHRKLRLGGGRARPVSFSRPKLSGTFVIANDGIFNYARPERIAAIVLQDLDRAARDLIPADAGSVGSRIGMPFDQSLRAALPVETELFALHLVDPATEHGTGLSVPGIRVRADGHTIATLQLIVREVVGDRPQVRDIKEQEVVLLRAGHRGDPRVDAYVAGWREAVLEVLTQQEALLKRDRAAFERFKYSIDRLMPHDFCAPEVLDLKRPQDAAAFTDAFLSSKKRLGRFLP
jgi:hypothetical protein